MKASPRIALIHATPLAVEPINSAFKQLWPLAKCMNVLDDSLPQDLAAQGQLTKAMSQRFIDLASYVKGTGCDGILFTCSAFGLAIEQAAAHVGIPTLKPNEAMFDQALSLYSGSRPLRIGLVASFAPSLPSMAAELEELAKRRLVPIQLNLGLAEGAMDDLSSGKVHTHHEKVAYEVSRLSEVHQSKVIMLAQFSMAAAKEQAQAGVTCPVLTSPECAVLALKKALI